MEPPATVRDLHARYPFWFGAFETAVIDDGLDLRREYWRVLGLTQTAAGTPRDRFLALWLDVCGEAGDRGRHRLDYLDVGLIGLRFLPPGPDGAANEEAVCHGFARWAVRQRPNRDLLLQRWREIEAVYPHDVTFWPPIVADVIAAAEDDLWNQTRVSGATFPAAAWWREEMELDQPRPGRMAPPSGRKRAIEPPPKETLDGVLAAVASPLPALQPRVEGLMAAHRRYADATGDVFYLVRTACNVGMRLKDNGEPTELEARGALAARLARSALDYEPNDAFAWSLWRDGLTAQGALAAAEDVGWEALRRMPEDPQWSTQLATLLAEGLGRAADAERLLRDAMAAFPDDAASPCQLATLLAATPERRDEAEALLRGTIKRNPENPHTYTQLAGLLAQRPEARDEAMEVLDALLAWDSEDRIARTLRGQIAAGRRPKAATTHLKIGRQTTPSPDALRGLDFSAARARRALFMAEAGSDAGALAEVRRLFAEDSGLAYVRYVAQRCGLAEAGGGLDTAFAVAFERAKADAAAMDALAARSRGRDALIARAAFTVITGGRALAPPDDDGLDRNGQSHRFRAVVAHINAGLKQADSPDRTPYLRLLSDFAAADLSRAA